MRARLAVVICAAAAAALAAMPAAASACASLARVKSFHGVAHMAFDAQASGPDEPGQPQYGSQTVTLDRSLAGLEVKLTHRDVTKLGVVAFVGKVSGGSVTIKDTFDDSGDNTAHKAERYAGALTNQLPNFGSATLFLDPGTCTYQLTVGFGVRAQLSGAVQGPDTVAGAAYSHRKHIPASLKLGGAAAPDAYYGGCVNAIFTGKSCYDLGGGFATDFMTLFDCHSAQAVNCSSSDGPVGVATLAWHLKPSYSHKKKKK